MSEWEHEGLPPFCDEAEVWLKDGSVRRISRDVWGQLRFIDRTHHLSNIICDAATIRAWRADKVLSRQEITSRIDAAYAQHNPYGRPFDGFLGLCGLFGCVGNCDASAHEAAYPGF